MTKYQKYDRSAKGKARKAKYRDTVKGVIERFKSDIASTVSKRRNRP